MNGSYSARVTPLMISAMRMACSSLSITHGPAIKNNSPEPMWTLPTWKDVVNASCLVNNKSHFTTEAQSHRETHFLIFLCVSVPLW